MDQELKQRLIGASVIIALAIIFIPMLFDNEVDKSGDKKIDIVIPESGSHPLSVKTFSLDDELPSDSEEVTVPESELSLVDDQVVSQDLVEGNGLIEKPTVSDEQDSANQSAVIQKPEDVITERASDSKSATNQTEHVQVTDTPAVDNQQEDTVAVSEKQSEEHISESNIDIFRVKLGSFSKADNAQQVKNKLAQQGIGSLVELAPDRALYRVWSDALYRDKSKAEDYVAAVTKLKLNIGMPKIIAVSEDEVKASAERGQLGWVVQLGSFAAKNNALDLRNRLKLAGFMAFVDVSNNSQGDTRYRLRVGPVNTREQATQLKQQISNKLQLKGLVKTHELASLVD